MSLSQLPVSVWLTRVRSLAIDNSLVNLQLHLLADLVETCLAKSNKSDNHNNNNNNYSVSYGIDDVFLFEDNVLSCWLLLEGATYDTLGSGSYVHWTLPPQVSGTTNASVALVDKKEHIIEADDKWEKMFPLRKEVNEAIEKCQTHKSLISNIFAHLLSQSDSNSMAIVRLQVNPAAVKIGVIKVSPKEMEAAASFFSAVKLQHAEITVNHNDNETQVQLYPWRL